jgi:hypothetical protein
MPTRYYGFIKDEIQPQDYIFGDAQITVDILQPDGQWDEFLPTDELQNLYGVEPYACVTFGTLNALEMLLRRVFTDVENFSDRYTAKVTGTEFNHGNSPQTVIEYIRKTGAIHEPDWPFTPDINTFEKFYAEPPVRFEKVTQLFPQQFEVKHDYVLNGSWQPSSPARLKNALQYSPIGISVYAWVQGDDGLYIKPAGAQDNHWCVLYGYEDGKFWKVFDSYARQGPRRLAIVGPFDFRPDLDEKAAFGQGGLFCAGVTDPGALPAQAISK